MTVAAVENPINSKTQTVKMVIISQAMMDSLNDKSVSVPNDLLGNGIDIKVFDEAIGDSMSLKTDNENKLQEFNWADPSAIKPVGFTKSSYERLKGEFEQSGLSVKEFIETELAGLPYKDDGCYIVMVAPEGEGNFDNPNVDKQLKYCAASLLFKIELEDMKSAGS